MPRGEPTKVVRLPVWLLDHLEGALAVGETMPEHITRRLAPRAAPVGRPDPTHRVDNRGRPVRCTCDKPTLSKVVTNLCTTCHNLR